MRILTIDTATDAVVTGVAEVDADAAPQVMADRTVTDHRRHAELLTTLIAESLGEAGVRGAELDAVVVGCGPGPFTGLRVGLATAAAFGDALGLPTYGVCTLDAIAAQEGSAQEGSAQEGSAQEGSAQEGSAQNVLVVTDARRREIYWARYRDGERIAGPDVVAPAALAADLADDRIDVVVGTPGFTDRFDRPVGRAQRPSVAGLATVAAGLVLSRARPEPLVPLYLRRPDAVELKDQKKRR